MCQEQVLATDCHKVESFSKTIENLSTLFDDIRKESYAVSNFEKAMIDFVKSATNLMEHWESLPRKIEPQITEHTRYPFQMRHSNNSAS